MNKDAILATLIGFGIGLLITGLLLVGPNLTKFLPKITLPTISFSQSKQKPAVTATPTPSQFTLTIESPLAEAIENSTDLLVSGVTSPGATVVIAGSVDDTVATAQSDGKYAGKVTLTEGKNDISVTAYLQTKQANQTITVYYSPESL
jgi:Glucodextranase, domain B